MPGTPQRNGSVGPLCHSTPKSEKAEESEPVGQVTSLPVSTHGWYRVLVFSKDHLGVNRVLRTIRRKITPLKLKPHYLHSCGEFDAAEDAGALFTFYVNGYAVASALFRLDILNSRLWLRVNHRMPVIQNDEPESSAAWLRNRRPVYVADAAETQTKLLCHPGSGYICGVIVIPC